MSILPLPSSTSPSLPFHQRIAKTRCGAKNAVELGGVDAFSPLACYTPETSNGRDHHRPVVMMG
jgi:hypothetical protein